MGSEDPWRTLQAMVHPGVTLAIKVAIKLQASQTLTLVLIPDIQIATMYHYLTRSD